MNSATFRLSEQETILVNTAYTGDYMIDSPVDRPAWSYACSLFLFWLICIFPCDVFQWAQFCNDLIGANSIKHRLGDETLNSGGKPAMGWTGNYPRYKCWTVWLGQVQTTENDMTCFYRLLVIHSFEWNHAETKQDWHIQQILIFF